MNKGIAGNVPASKVERGLRAMRSEERRKRKYAHEQLMNDQRRAKLEKKG